MSLRVKKIIAGLILAALVLCAALYTVKFGSATAGNSEKSGSLPADSAAVIVTESEIGSYTADIVLSDDTISISGSGVEAEDNVVSIVSGGTYRISGSLSSGQIHVNVSGDEDVILVLNGVSVANEEGPAVYVENSGSMCIVLSEGTENTFVSGSETEIDGTLPSDSAEGGAVLFKDDATISGTGTLNVYGYINNGIHCSNNLYIEDGIINVYAVHTGIKGKDSLTVDGGTISVWSSGDGLKSDDDTGDGYGLITVNGGTINVNSYGDCLTAATVLTVNDGVLNLTGVETESSSSSGFGLISGDVMRDQSNGYSSDISCKGLKAGTDLIINGGTITVDTPDDAVHSDGNAEINAGDIILSSQDDGVHADDSLVINGGNIEVLASYEGIEGNYITVNDGTVEVTSSDDGFNASSGSWTWGSSSSDLPQLIINGGTINVNASGDGLDSNGDLIVNGGFVIVDGPSSSANGALDSGSENGGSIAVNGGTLLAVGASGMAEVPEDSSEQAFLSVSASYSAGSTITIKDSNGIVLCSLTTEKSGDSLVFSCESVDEGSDVIIDIDGTETTVTMGTVSSGIGTGGMGGKGGSL